MSISQAIRTAITFRNDATAGQGARYISGQVVFDEMFRAGRLCTRYWNPNGQVWPEMHFASQKWNLDQPADTFRLAIDGRDLAGGYVWESPAVEPDPSALRASGRPVVHGTICLLHAQAQVRVKVHTRVDGGPFVVRWLEISNLSKDAAGITAVAPFAGALWNHRCEEHLPADQTTPFELAYNHRFEWGQEGDFWFEPLTSGGKIVDGGKKGRSGWGRPAFWARNLCNGQTVVCELAWGGNYEFALDCRLNETDFGWGGSRPARLSAELYFGMGLGGHDRVLRVLDAGQTLVTPAVHLGMFKADTDAIVQATHEHVRQVVMPAQIPGRENEIEANHRGYLCDRENVADIQKDIDVAAAAGAEMYVIDAGWYGNEPNQWWQNVGDWRDGPWMNEGGGLKAVADYARHKGLKFGLWVEIEAVGGNSTLRKEHPEWVALRDGQPVAGGRALDLTRPEVAAWCEAQIERLIGTLDLDMYRIDHNHMISPSPNRVYKGFTEDLTWRYYDSLYAMFDRLRRKYPKVVFQNCAGGGGRLDWGTMARFHNTELSDWMRLPRGFKILNGVTMSLPPEVLLRAFGTEAGEHTLDGDVDSQLRHNFCRIILRGIAPTMAEMTEYLRERVGHYLEIYREHIRPIMRDGLVYHHTPFLKHGEAAPWCVLEYSRKDRNASVAVVMRTSAAGEDTITFRPRGLDPTRLYEVLLDNRGLRYRASGHQLGESGIRMRLEQELASELLLVQAV